MNDPFDDATGPEPGFTGIVQASPPALRRANTQIHSRVARDIARLHAGEAFGIETGGNGEAHKLMQRKINARIQLIRKTSPERTYVTRTLQPGDIFGPHVIEKTMLGIFRIG